MSGVEDASARPDMGVERGSDASDRGRMDGDLPFSQCVCATEAVQLVCGVRDWDNLVGPTYQATALPGTSCIEHVMGGTTHVTPHGSRTPAAVPITTGMHTRKIWQAVGWLAGWLTGCLLCCLPVRTD